MTVVVIKLVRSKDSGFIFLRKSLMTLPLQVIIGCSNISLFLLVLKISRMQRQVNGWLLSTWSVRKVIRVPMLKVEGAASGKHLFLEGSICWSLALGGASNSWNLSDPYFCSAWSYSHSWLKKLFRFCLSWLAWSNRVRKHFLAIGGSQWTSALRSCPLFLLALPVCNISHCLFLQANSLWWLLFPHENWQRNYLLLYFLRFWR